MISTAIKRRKTQLKKINEILGGVKRPKNFTSVGADDEQKKFDLFT